MVCDHWWLCPFLQTQCICSIGCIIQYSVAQVCVQLGLFMVAIFRPFLAHFHFLFFKKELQKRTSKESRMTWKMIIFTKWSTPPPILQRWSFLFLLSHHFHVPFPLCFQTPLWHLNHQWQHPLPHTSTTTSTTLSPPAVTTPMPMPTSTNTTNCCKPTTLGPNDDRSFGCFCQVVFFYFSTN